MIVISRTRKNVKHPFYHMGKYIAMHIKIDEKQKNPHEMSKPFFCFIGFRCQKSCLRRGFIFESLCKN